MKNIFCLIFVLFASLTAFAQEKNIEKAEFDKVYKNSFQWLPDQGHREIRTEESIFEAIPMVNTTSLPTVAPSSHKSYMKMTAEFLPRKLHTIYESNSESVSSRDERIMISGKSYSRKDNGKWTETVLESRPKTEPKTKTTDVKIEYKYLGEEMLNDRKTTAYAKIETGKLVNLTDNRESFSTSTTKYWFDQNGLILKTEGNREIRNEKTVSKFKSGTVYETDSNIKIETPNLN